MNRKTCNGPTAGYTCDACGSESAEHDPQHTCGGDHCMPKRMGRNKAEARCACG